MTIASQQTSFAQAITSTRDAADAAETALNAAWQAVRVFATDFATVSSFDEWPPSCQDLHQALATVERETARHLKAIRAHYKQAGADSRYLADRGVADFPIVVD